MTSLKATTEGLVDQLTKKLLLKKKEAKKKDNGGVDGGSLRGKKGG